MHDDPLHQLYTHYSELPYSQRVLYTATLLVLGLGYLFALVYLFHTQVGRDGKSYMTVEDIVITYSGTGKGLLARFIHDFSATPDAPFVKVNCAAIPGPLLESELFGYEKGSFTGAHSVKPGRVELANGGTLFLDGIDEIDMSLQAKLLQLLQDGQFSRIGGQEDKHVRLCVLCATSRRLAPAG